MQTRLFCSVVSDPTQGRWIVKAQCKSHRNSFKAWRLFSTCLKHSPSTQSFQQSSARIYINSKVYRRRKQNFMRNHCLRRYQSFFYGKGKLFVKVYPTSGSVYVQLAICHGPKWLSQEYILDGYHGN